MQSEPKPAGIQISLQRIIESKNLKTLINTIQELFTILQREKFLYLYFFFENILSIRVWAMAQKIKNLPQCRRPGFDPWVGKIPWKRNGNPLQYPCLDNSMDRGAWWATWGHKESNMTERLKLFFIFVSAWVTR